MRRVAALLLAAAAASCAQDTPRSEREQADAERDGSDGLRFRWRRHPSIRVGNWLRVDFRARFQLDWEIRDPEIKDTPELFDIERKRLAVEGVLFRHFEFEVSRELSDVNFPWKDVYGNLRYFRRFQIRAGRFRIPFSLDQLTGPTNLDFIERSRIAERLAPNRDTGVMLHGWLAENGFRYQAGYFRNDGDNAADREQRRTGEDTLAGRILARPGYFVPRLPGVFGNLMLGAAFTTSRVPEGLYGLRGRSVTDETIFPHYFVKGRRNRAGAEFEWMPGPFSIKSEYIAASEARKGQGLTGDDLPDLIHRGYYVSATWAVTGQAKARGLDRGRRVPFISRKAWGALELAARNEFIRFGSARNEGRPSRSTRAANILGNSDRAWTFGVNWYLNQWTKMQANTTRERLEDAFRSPIAGRNIFWSHQFRLQLSL